MVASEQPGDQELLTPGTGGSTELELTREVDGDHDVMTRYYNRYNRYNRGTVVSPGPAGFS